MVSVAVIGAGAIGGTVAAHLSAIDPESVAIASRTPFDRLEVQTPGGVLRATPRPLTDPDLAREVDVVIVATKAYDVAGTAVWLRPLVGPHTTVAVLQNGVEHVERFAPHVPREQILPVVVTLAAHRSAPGRITHSGRSELIVPDSGRGIRFAELFASSALTVTPTSDFVTAAWRKLALNAPGAITATMLVPGLDMSAPASQRLVREVVHEAIAVGRAEGATLAVDLADEIVAGFPSARDGSPNSLHADRLAGRPLEVDARNGAVVRIGSRHAVPTPVNGVLVDLLSIVDPAATTRQTVGA